MNDTTFVKDHELECKCGCGLNNIEQDIVDRLNGVRILCGFPLFFNSGCRCESHNKNVGGVSNSSHRFGEAVDISCIDDSKRFILVEALYKMGFRRILLYKSFIHVDISTSKKKDILKLMI